MFDREKINFGWWQPFYCLVAFVVLSLEKVTGRRANLLLSGALGLGLGLSLIVSTTPSGVMAANFDSPTARQSRITIDRVKMPSLGIEAEVQLGQIELLPFKQLTMAAVHLENSAPIGRVGTTVIQGGPADYGFKTLEQAQLGQDVYLLGSNQGWYRYQVVAIKSISYDQLTTAFYQVQDSLVLLTIQPFHQTAQVVIAKMPR